MNKSTQKKLHMGFELKINRTGQKGSENWVRVAGIFPSISTAKKYCFLNHENLAEKQIQVMGLYVEAIPKFKHRFHSSLSKKEANNVE